VRKKEVATKMDIWNCPADWRLGGKQWAELPYLPIRKRAKSKMIGQYSFEYLADPQSFPPLLIHPLLCFFPPFRFKQLFDSNYLRWILIWIQGQFVLVVYSAFHGSKAVNHYGSCPARKAVLLAVTWIPKVTIIRS
jgi:hypothetical protein